MRWNLAQQRFYRRQVAQLNAATGHFDDNTRRDVLERITGKRSTEDCTSDELSRVIDEQRRLLAEVGIRERRPRTRRVRSQEEYIELLVREVGWEGQPERLNGFIARQFKGWYHSLDALSRVERSKLIVALRALKRDLRAGRATLDRPAPGRASPGRSWQPEVILGTKPMEGSR